MVGEGKGPMCAWQHVKCTTDAALSRVSYWLGSGTPWCLYLHSVVWTLHVSSQAHCSHMVTAPGLCRLPLVCVCVCACVSVLFSVCMWVCAWPEESCVCVWVYMCVCVGVCVCVYVCECEREGLQCSLPEVTPSAWQHAGWRGRKPVLSCTRLKHLAREITPFPWEACNRPSLLDLVHFFPHLSLSPSPAVSSLLFSPGNLMPENRVTPV